MKHIAPLAIVAALALCLVAAKPATEKKPPAYLNGVVTNVHDGDTLTLADFKGVEHTIRLHGVDCPELASKGRWGEQPGSQAALDFAWCLAAGKETTVITRNRDRYGRTVGEVFVDGRSLNRELVRAGLAWWSKKYAAKDLDLKRLQEQAKKQRLGIWRYQAVEPWEWRKK